VRRTRCSCAVPGHFHHRRARKHCSFREPPRASCAEEGVARQSSIEQTVEEKGDGATGPGVGPPVLGWWRQQRGEAFVRMTAEEALAEVDRRVRVALRLGYLEERTGPDGATEYRVVDRMWWHKCRWPGREHEGWVPFVEALVPDGEGEPSPDEALRRIELALARGLIQEMPGEPGWLRVVDARSGRRRPSVRSGGKLSGSPAHLCSA